MTDPSDRQLPIDPGAVPVAPGLEDALESTKQYGGFRAPPEYAAVDRRTIGVCAGAVLVAIGAGLAAQLLIRLIGLVTNATFFGRLSSEFVAPRFGTHNPLLIIAIPVGGAIIVGLMARYGSAAIRGHGIPEVMERVLYSESRIPARVTLPQAALGGDRDRNRRSVRRRRADHRNGRRARLAAGTARPRHRRRAQDAARRGRRRGHGGDVRQSGVRRAARGRAAAVRVSPALAHPRGAGRRRRHRRSRGVQSARRRSSRSRRSPSRAARRSSRTPCSARHRRRARSASPAFVVRRRGRVREAGSAAHSLDVVARARRDRRRRGRLIAPRTLGVGYENIDAIVSRRNRRAGAARAGRAQVRLVGGLSRQRHVGRHARAVVHHRRRPRRVDRRAVRRSFVPWLGVDAHVAASSAWPRFSPARRARCSRRSCSRSRRRGSRSACSRCSPGCSARHISSRCCSCATRS